MDEVLSVECPTCGFKAGHQCHAIVDNGATTQTRAPHAERKEAAEGER